MTKLYGGGTITVNTDYTLPAESYQFKVTAGATEGTEVRAELKAAEEAKHAKRIKRIAKAHQRAWYATPNNGDVAIFAISDTQYGVAIARELDNGDVVWAIGGKDGTHSFPDFVKYLVDRKVHATDVEYR